MLNDSNDPPSLIYIEDPYFTKLDNTATPSLDDENNDEEHEHRLYHWSEETENYLRSLKIEDILNLSSDDEDERLRHHSNDSDNEGYADDDEVMTNVINNIDLINNYHYDCNQTINDLNDELQQVETEFLFNNQNLNNTANNRNDNNNKFNLINNNKRLTRLLNNLTTARLKIRIKNFLNKNSTGVVDTTAETKGKKSSTTLHDVKVTFIDFSKPYLAKISSNDNYKKFLNIGSGSGNSNNANNDQHQQQFYHQQQQQDSPKMSEASPVGSVGSASEAVDELQGLTLEEQERQRAEWSQELARVEEEITTLRTVLGSKTRHANELKRKLGITVWKEITEDMNQGIKNVKESNVYQSVETKVGNITKAVHDAPIYQKTESVVKTTAEKTTNLIGGFTAGLTTRFSQMKNSDSFKSFEEKVGGAYENVKSKVSTSRSNSMNSFDDVQSNRSNSTAPQSPSIPEGKPIP